MLLLPNDHPSCLNIVAYADIFPYSLRYVEHDLVETIVVSLQVFP
jgi:hypothetical protein